MCAALCGTRADRRSPESLISSSVSGGGDGGGIRNRTHFVSCILLIRMTELWERKGYYLSCSAGSGCACEKAGEEGAVIPLDASGEDDGGERRFVGGMLVGSSQANRRVMSHHIALLEESRCRWKKVGCV